MFGWLKKGAAAQQAPASADALRQRGDELLAQDDFEAAAGLYLQAVAADGGDAKALTSLGFARSQQGRAAEAIDALAKAAAADPASADPHYMLGTLHEQAGDLRSSLEHLRRAVMLAPGFDLAVRDLARVLAQSGQPQQARGLLEGAIERNPGFADFHSYLGHLQMDAGDGAAAAVRYARAAELEPGNPDAHVHLGLAQEKAGDLVGAAASYGRALQLAPAHAQAHNGLGNVQRQSANPQAALASYAAAVAADPMNVDAAGNLGNALRMAGRLGEALEATSAALVRHPNHAELHHNRGNILVLQKRPAEALPSYQRALALNPDSPSVLTHLGHALNALKRPQEALAAYARGLNADPGAPWLYGAWLNTRLAVCEWPGIEGAFAEAARRIAAGERCALPFGALALPLSAAAQLQCATAYVQDMGLAPAQPLAGVKKPRIRLGYFSADFHDHATARLAAGLFEHHDRERFEVIAFSFGPRSSHPMRARLEAAFDQFIDVAAEPDLAVAQRARAMGIDIAIDLKGYTEDCRSGIFALRAAPLQVNYLGHPGTMGAPFMDYILADATVIPPQAEPFYAEKVARLPHSYQVNDTQREVAARDFTRAELGLPQDGFVFCCLNNNYKITPDVFDVWMRLLHAVPGSVLWLLQDNADAATNLRTEARKRGVDAARLVFAARVDMPLHLARQRQADLFLDTLHYNAHTTASDALWVGLPVLTCTGETFAARVGTSLVRAAGTGEMAVGTLQEYEQLALTLATDPPRLAAVRERLRVNRQACPLFDTALFTRHAEAAYTAMWQRHLDGLPPAHIDVPA